MHEGGLKPKEVQSTLLLIDPRRKTPLKGDGALVQVNDRENPTRRLTQATGPMRKQSVLLKTGVINTNTRGLDYRMGKQLGVLHSLHSRDQSVEALFPCNILYL